MIDAELLLSVDCRGRDVTVLSFTETFRKKNQLTGQTCVLLSAACSLVTQTTVSARQAASVHVAVNLAKLPFDLT